MQTFRGKAIDPPAGATWAFVDIPGHFPDSNPPGFKFWVGDLPGTADRDSMWERLAATLYEANLESHLPYIGAVVVKNQAARSGCSYMVVTGEPIATMMVSQLTCKSLCGF